jgi:hypothetical protein
MGLGVANFILNMLVVALLMATITYCWILNRRIKILQDSKSELSSLLQYFDESTTRASESIIALQSASKKIGDNIQTRIDKANYLMDDLVFMIEKGSKLANQLEASFAVSRARSRVQSEVVDPVEAIEKPALAERDSKPLPVVERPSPIKTTPSMTTKEKTAASLEAVLDRVIGRGKSNSNGKDRDDDATNGVVRKGATAKSRSKAEQELLDMIRAGIKG